VVGAVWLGAVFSIAWRFRFHPFLGSDVIAFGNDTSRLLDPQWFHTFGILHRTSRSACDRSFSYQRYRAIPPFPDPSRRQNVSNTVRRLWIAVIVLAGTAIGSGAFAAQASQGSARNFLTQDAGTGTAAQSAESSKMTSEVRAKRNPTQTPPVRKLKTAEAKMTSEDAGTGTVKRAAQKNTRTLTGCLRRATTRTSSRLPRRMAAPGRSRATA